MEKKTPALTEAGTSAEHTRHFTGIENPRHLRAAYALLDGDRTRQELDTIAGCANSPDLVMKLRGLGLAIQCHMTPTVDRDGREVLQGVHHLTTDSKRLVRDWLSSHASTGSPA